MSSSLVEVEPDGVEVAQTGELARWISSWWMAPILAYHRVGEPRADHVPTVTAECFEAHMAFLARRGFQVLELSEIAQRLSSGPAALRRCVAITFDDGYAETCTIAAPILRRFGFPATVFVAPGEVGLPGFMTWEELRRLSREGVTIGSHTMHHSYLPLVAPVRARRELVESKQILEQRLERPVDWISYPVGGYTAEIQAMAREAGYHGGCTTNRGVSKREKDLFALRRIKMTDRGSHPILLSVKLSGYYDLFRALKTPA
ncbi:MAG: polysaccharide deacetylase family protein [Candidatus Omnitrophica bacterium]|nr:polysaccharide deacetylase family protein [Candidatus Omnitrophota bacterium]